MPNVVISGASTGIGRASALQMARLGWRVFAGVRREEDAASLRAADEHIEPILLAVTKPEQIEAAYAQVAEAVGEEGLQGLVNNAGIAVAAPLEFIPPDLFRRQFEVNVFGNLAVTQKFLPLIRKGQGRIVNVSSISGHFVFPLLGPYAASKFALEAITDGLRRELEPWDIQVISLAPGAVRTPIWNKSFKLLQEAFARMPEEAAVYYGPLVEAWKNRSSDVKGESGMPVAVMAEAVEVALTTPNPKPRYFVGKEARTIHLLSRLFSPRWMDGFVKRMLKLE